MANEVEKVNTDITEISDITKILTKIAEGVWDEYKDDNKITVGEITGVIMKRIPETLRDVNFKQLTEQIKGFKVKENKGFFKNELIDLVWAVLFDLPGEEV